MKLFLIFFIQPTFPSKNYAQDVYNLTNRNERFTTNMVINSAKKFIPKFKSEANLLANEINGLL